MKSADYDFIKGTLTYVECPSGFPLVLHKQNKESPHYQKWVAPGGTLREGESFIDGARRTLVETLGEIDIENLRRVGTAKFINSQRTVHAHFPLKDYLTEIYRAESYLDPRPKKGIEIYAPNGDKIDLWDRSEIGNFGRKQQESDARIFDLILRDREEFDIEFYFQGNHIKICIDNSLPPLKTSVVPLQ